MHYGATQHRPNEGFGFRLKVVTFSMENIWQASEMFNGTESDFEKLKTIFMYHPKILGEVYQKLRFHHVYTMTSCIERP